MNKIRVGFILRDFQFGGCQKQVYLYMKYLDKVRYDTHLLTLVANPEFPEVARNKFLDLPIRVHTPPAVRKNSLHSILPWLGRTIQEIKLDAVLSFQWRCDLITAITCRLIGFRKHIINERGDRVWIGYKRSIYRQMADRMIVFPSVNMATANSIEGCRILEEEGVPVERIKHIPNGIEIGGMEDVPQDETADTVTRMRKGNGYYVFAFIGTIKEMKGHLNLVEAVRLLTTNEGLRNFHILMIGDGDQRPFVERRIKNYGLDRYFTITGYRTNPAEYLPLCDCGLMLSETEGFPNVVLEYMLAKKPVVATKAGNIPFMLEHMNNALLVDYGDIRGLAESLKYCILNPAPLGQMAQRAFQLVMSKYEISNVVDLYHDTIEKVASSENRH